MLNLMEKLILWIFVCEVFEVEILLALRSPQTFWQLTVSNHWSNRIYGYNMFTLKKKKKHDWIRVELLASLWHHKYCFFQWILTSLWRHKWIQQKGALLSLAVVQQGFLFLHSLTGAKQHLQVFGHDQMFLFLALRMPHSQPLSENWT